MKCNSCSAEVPNGTQYCGNCGAKVEPVLPNPNANQTQPQANNTVQAPTNVYAPNRTSISLGGWIGRMLIPLIPFVGGLIYLIMLFVWASDTTKEESFRNWAKANLILIAISFGISIIVVVIALILGFSGVLSSAIS